MYGETLGKWRTADLLIGLAYLARRESDEHPCSHVAQRGTPLGHGMSVAECQAALDEMRVIQRFMKYCVAMRERRAAVKQRMMSNIGIGVCEGGVGGCGGMWCGPSLLWRVHTAHKCMCVCTYSRHVYAHAHSAHIG